MVIAGGVQMNLLEFDFVGTEAWQKERRRTRSHIKFVDLLEADTGVPRDCLPAVMDDRVGWRKRAMGGRLRTT